MKRTLFPVMAAMIAGSLLLVGCSSSAPAPTQVPAAPSKPPAAAEPTKAQAAQPTAVAAAQPTAAAPAKTVDYPQKGKTITLIVPFSAGGTNDVGARLIAPLLEKELGTTIQVVNKPGASTQIGATELVNSKPDGYTLMMFSVPTTLITYIDPSRKAPYDLKNFAIVGCWQGDTTGVAVPTDSPFKTFDDFYKAAKERNLKIGVTGLLGSSHLAMTYFARELGVTFEYVPFDSGSEAVNAVLGGHIDAATVGPGNMANLVKQGKLRVLVMTDGRKEHPLFPGVPTTGSLGYKTDAQSYHMVAAPAGTPQAIIDLLGTAITKAAADKDFQSKIEATGLEMKILNAAEAQKIVVEKDAWVREIYPIAKAQATSK